MRKEGLENLTLTAYIEGKWVREKQRITYLLILCKGLTEQGLGETAKIQTLLSATKGHGRFYHRTEMRMRKKQLHEIGTIGSHTDASATDSGWTIWGPGPSVRARVPHSKPDPASHHVSVKRRR